MMATAFFAKCRPVGFAGALAAQRCVIEWVPAAWNQRPIFVSH